MATLTPGGTSTMGSTSTPASNQSMVEALVQNVYGAPWKDLGRYLTVAHDALAGQPLRYNAAMQYGGDYGIYDPTGRMNNELGRSVWLNAQPYYLGWAADRNAAMGAASKEPGWDSRAWNEANPMPTGTGLINAINDWRRTESGQAYSSVLGKAKETYNQWAPSYVSQMKSNPMGSAYSRLPDSAYEFKNASQTWSVPTAPGFAAAAAMKMLPSTPSTTTYSPTPAPATPGTTPSNTPAGTWAPRGETTFTGQAPVGMSPSATQYILNGQGSPVANRIPLAPGQMAWGNATTAPSNQGRSLNTVTGGGYGNNTSFFLPYMRY